MLFITTYLYFINFGVKAFLIDKAKKYDLEEQIISISKVDGIAFSKETSKRFVNLLLKHYSDNSWALHNSLPKLIKDNSFLRVELAPLILMLSWMYCSSGDDKTSFITDNFVGTLTEDELSQLKQKNTPGLMPIIDNISVCLRFYKVCREHKIFIPAGDNSIWFIDAYLHGNRDEYIINTTEKICREANVTPQFISEVWPLASRKNSHMRRDLLEMAIYMLSQQEYKQFALHFLERSGFGLDDEQVKILLANFKFSNLVETWQKKQVQNVLINTIATLNAEGKSEKFIKEMLDSDADAIIKYSSFFEYLFPGITFLLNTQKPFIETLFYGDLREFSLQENNRLLVKLILEASTNSTLVKRILTKDEKGNYYIIEKIKKFSSLGLEKYIPYVIKFPEGTDVAVMSKKFTRLLREGETALKEFGADIEGEAPTIFTILPDLFAIIQVVSPAERQAIARLFEEDWIYTLSAIDLPYFIENYIVYPEATVMALEHGQLNRYYIEIITKSLAVDKEKTIEGLQYGFYGEELFDFVRGQETLQSRKFKETEEQLANEQVRQEAILVMRDNPQFLDAPLRDILDRAKAKGLIVSLLSGSSRNPLARYFLKGKLNREELAKRTAVHDIDIRIKEILLSKTDLNAIAGISEDLALALKERLGERKAWLPAFDGSLAGKLKRFDKVALDELYIKRYLDILDSELGRELLRPELESLYIYKDKSSQIDKDKVREIFQQKSSKEFVILQNIVLLLEEATSKRISEAGISVDIRGDYSAVTRGDVNINAIEIFYDRKENLDIFDPEQGLADFKQNKYHISKGTQSIYGKYRPVNTMVKAVSEIALADMLRFFRPSIQFGLQLDNEEVRVVKTGMDLLVHKGRGEFLADKIQRNADKMLEFLSEENLTSDQIRALLESLGSISRFYPQIFSRLNTFFSEGIIGKNVIYQYLTTEQRIKHLEGEQRVFLNDIAIHYSGGINSKEISTEVPIEKIVEEKGLRPGLGQGQTKGKPGVYFTTDSDMNVGSQKGILFIYDKSTLDNLITGKTELRDGVGPLSEYGAYLNWDEKTQAGTRHYVISLPEGEKDVLPLKFAKVVYLSPELYTKAETSWRRVLNSRILTEIINNPEVEPHKRVGKIIELKKELGLEWFGRDLEGGARNFEDVFKNIFSVEFRIPDDSTILPMLTRAANMNNQVEIAELSKIAVEVFKKNPQEISDAIKASSSLGQEEEGIAGLQVAEQKESASSAVEGKTQSPIEAIKQKQREIYAQRISGLINYHGSLAEKPPDVQSHATSSKLVWKMIFDSGGFITPQPTDNLNAPGVPYIFLSTIPSMDYADKAVVKYGGQPVALIFDLKILSDKGIVVNPGGNSTIFNPDTKEPINIKTWDGYNETNQSIPLAFLTQESKKEVIKALFQDAKDEKRILSFDEIAQISKTLNLEIQAVERISSSSAVETNISYIQKLLAKKLGLNEEEAMRQVAVPGIYSRIGRKAGFFTEAEHNAIFDFFWKVNLNKYGVYLSAGLKNKIISNRDKISSYYGIPYVGIVNHATIKEIQALGLTTQEKDELWDTFRMHNPAAFNRTSDEINDRVVSIYKYVDAALVNKNSIRVLDLGCGKAKGIQTLKDKYRDKIEAYGIDQKITVNSDNVILAQGQIKTMPWENDYFDLIYSSNVMYYFEKTELPDILKEIYRVLKPGGKFIFDDMPNVFESRKNDFAEIDPQINVEKDRIGSFPPFIVVIKPASSAVAEKGKGGIDLTPKNLGLEVKEINQGDGYIFVSAGNVSKNRTVPVVFDPATFHGFTFQITSIIRVDKLESIFSPATTVSR